MINPWVIAAAAAFLYLLGSIRVLQKTERGVISRLGRVVRRAQGPGLILVFAPFDRLVRISLLIEGLDQPRRSAVRHENVTVKVHTAIFFRAIDLRRTVLTQEYVELCFAQDAAKRGLSQMRCQEMGIGDYSNFLNQQAKQKDGKRWKEKLIRLARYARPR
jgi:regulator of protease activity HflC (stomatin/prohibitin superfamily)